MDGRIPRTRARRRPLALVAFCAALLAGCADDVDDDLYARCKKDPACRGQACVDVRGELYARGDYKSASRLECSVD